MVKKEFSDKELNVLVLSTIVFAVENFQVPADIQASLKKIVAGISDQGQSMEYAIHAIIREYASV